MGFKEDAVFARNLTMGAYGAVALKNDLELHDHSIIELERYALANKVWGIKVKRLRIPDLLCIRCGRRFEAKGKSKLEIQLSDSATAGREWDAGGMRDEDIFGFVRVAIAEQDVRIGRPVYVTRAALQDAYGTAKKSTRKAVSAGSELSLSWPIWVPSYSGQLSSIEPFDSGGNVYVQKLNGGRRTYKRKKEWSQVYLYLSPGESFEGTFTAVAGSVAPASIECVGDAWDWRLDLTAPNDDDRYAAVKSCYMRQDADLDALLGDIAHNDQDWRVRLEAAGVLAAADASAWVPFLRAFASDVSMAPEQQIEGVFLLSDLASTEAADALYDLARPESNRPEEVRAAAVWGLGVGANKRPEWLVEFLSDDSDRVALHAASSLTGGLPSTVIESLQQWLFAGEERKAAVAASLLARHGHVQALLEAVETSNAFGSMLALRALGDLPRDQVERGASGPIRPETLKALEPIWIQHRDWLRRPENLGALDILDAQQIRFS
ncbi:HEAT repeat domain-containing protein [Nonomuraea sp. NEAU-A123]|uniref:HEAT repeat domain-containing protein n=1 Tax=Nonomuraea sp. NEAU-A123 TaxID=2839649 RepID=UPI001BE419AB|nr:hypothetical protein [Nonomuraea sp. NEAU-A123]MBT2232289.1 hypothetical protein [Nonomuraea sp. NEAU-A123]